MSAQLYCSASAVPTDLILGQGLFPPPSLNPLLVQMLYLLNKQAVILQRRVNTCCTSGQGGSSWCSYARAEAERRSPSVPWGATLPLNPLKRQI